MQSSLKVIYLDDEADLGGVFTEIFSRNEISVQAVSSVDKGISLIQATSPDLVFIDFRLPGTTGVEVAKKLDPKLKKVLVTGDPHAADEGLFIKVFPKPYPLNEIRDFLLEQLRALRAAA
jgi:DNA-binding NtrC family response regulator